MTFASREAVKSVGGIGGLPHAPEPKK